jgi:hypothetical protein
MANSQVGQGHDGLPTTQLLLDMMQGYVRAQAVEVQLTGGGVEEISLIVREIWE